MSELPNAGDPLIIGMGQVITEVPVEKDGYVSADEYVERTAIQRFVNFRPVREVSIDQTPEADKQTQLAISVVVSLRLMGMIPTDIAEILAVPLEEIKRITSLPATQHTFERMLRNIINANAENTQGRISSYANKAVDTVISMMENEETRDDVRLKAAQDVLDRSGTNADQFFGSDAAQSAREDELTIVVTDDEDNDEKVKISMKRKA